jgi:hypothetical protein
MTSDNKLAAWRFGLIFGFLLMESAVRLGWISSFFLASPLQALTVLWAQLARGNALVLTAITLYEIAAALFISTVIGLLRRDQNRQGGFGLLDRRILRPISHRRHVRAALIYIHPGGTGELGAQNPVRDCLSVA